MVRYLFYDYVNSWSIKPISEKIISMDKAEDFTMHMHTYGGETGAGIAFLSNLMDIKGKKNLNIDGNAISMGAFWMPFFDHVVANDMSEIMFHTAAYPSWYKPTKTEQEQLDKANAKFEEKVRIKVFGKQGAEEFLNKLFDKEVRNDVYLNAQQAMTLGLVHEIKTLTPAASLEHNVVMELVNKQINNNLNNKKMDIEKLKSEHPSVFAAVFALGKESGMTEERDRVQAHLAFIDIDKESVVKGINDGKPVGQKEAAEYVAKSITKMRLETHKEDNTETQHVEAGAETKSGEVNLNNESVTY